MMIPGMSPKRLEEMKKEEILKGAQRNNQKKRKKISKNKTRIDVLAFIGFIKDLDVKDFLHYLRIKNRQTLDKKELFSKERAN